MPPTLLKNIQIQEISLVKAGANGVQFITKAADGAPRVMAAIKKTDSVKKIAVGIVYQPDTPDSDNEMATAEEIEKAAWGALQNHAIVKTGHKESEAAPAFLAESYIVKAGDPDEFPEGGWAVVVKVEDDALWEQIEKGEFQAFSMGGAAEKAPVEKQGESDPGEEVEKEVSIDSMVYVTGLKDVLAVVTSIAQNLGDVVKAVGEIAEKASGKNEELEKRNEEINKAVETMGETVKKIAEATTDGRTTSSAPGGAGVDPAKY